jgi:serine/threonine protein kinase
VDASGGKWSPIYKVPATLFYLFSMLTLDPTQMPDHIFTVYRPMDSSKKFIAKKVQEDSNELELLRFLDTIPRKSDHVISLVDSFHGWAILPKLDAVKGYIDFGPRLSESKVSQLCVGLIKGLTYLHEHCIAHRDIKPDNLLVNNENFRLIITDFDIAMRVEDEDEEVDDQCGTKHWMAPEVKENLRHSPIKADRWSCGHVILYFLGKSKQEGKHLRSFATKLTARDPKQRPPLLEWESLSDAPLMDVAVSVSDVGEKRKALRHLQGKMIG